MKEIIPLRLRTLCGPLVVTALVAATTLISLPPLRDAATLQPLATATLHHPPGYLVGAPLFALWDTMTLLTVSQHYAFLATLILLPVGVRTVALLRAWQVRPSGPSPRGILRELLLAVCVLAAIFALYAGAALIPRPMAALRLSDPDLLAVDFHSHTHHSHDGRTGFTSAHSRAWHEAAGFAAAYLTDHYNWLGVDDALPRNPVRAGERTVLLSGMEVRMSGRHVNILGDRGRYIFALDSSWHHLDPDSMAQSGAESVQPPTIIYTIPAPLGPLDTLPEIVAIELIDGAPRGLEQSRRDRATLLALADSLNVAVVAASNHHGWGRAAPAWSVMRIPGWTELSPLALGQAIETALHRDRRHATTVVERRLPYHDGSRVRLAATVPWLLWEQLRMLTPLERLGWLGWAALWAALSMARAGRRTPGRLRR